MRLLPSKPTISFLGMWSSGTRLADSAVIAGHETLEHDLPSHKSVEERRAALVLRPGDDASSHSLDLRCEQALRLQRNAKQVLALQLPGLSRVAAKLSTLTRMRSQRAPDSGKKPWFSKRAREERARAAEKRQLALEGKNLFSSTEAPLSPVKQRPQTLQVAGKRMTPTSKH